MLVLFTFLAAYFVSMRKYMLQLHSPSVIALWYCAVGCSFVLLWWVMLIGSRTDYSAMWIHMDLFQRAQFESKVTRVNLSAPDVLISYASPEQLLRLLRCVSLYPAAAYVLRPLHNGGGRVSHASPVPRRSRLDAQRGGGAYRRTRFSQFSDGAGRAGSPWRTTHSAGAAP